MPAMATTASPAMKLLIAIAPLILDLRMRGKWGLEREVSGRHSRPELGWRRSTVQRCGRDWFKWCEFSYGVERRPAPILRYPHGMLEAAQPLPRRQNRAPDTLTQRTNLAPVCNCDARPLRVGSPRARRARTRS